MINSVLQGCKDRDWFLPIPYISRHPMTCATPFMETQSLEIHPVRLIPTLDVHDLIGTYAVRVACSFF